MSLHALILSCTLKSSPEISNTEALAAKVTDRLNEHGVTHEILRVVDYDIKPGTASDMGEGDEWPKVLKKIKEADIFIIAAPIWLGHLCSLGQRVIERLDAIYYEKDLQDDKGRYFSMGKVGGVVITGNEDGGHEVAGHVLWVLQELGWSIPANANAFWVGASGNRKDYLDAGGPKEKTTNGTAITLADNLVHLANLLKTHPYTTDLKANFQ